MRVLCQLRAAVTGTVISTQRVAASTPGKSVFAGRGLDRRMHPRLAPGQPTSWLGSQTAWPSTAYGAARRAVPDLFHGISSVMNNASVLLSALSIQLTEGAGAVREAVICASIKWKLTTWVENRYQQQHERCSGLMLAAQKHASRAGSAPC